MKDSSSPPSAQAIRRQAHVPVILTHGPHPWSHATPPGIGGGNKQKEDKKKK